MANYRRLRCKGGTYFFTARLSDRNSDLLTQHILVLRRAFRATMATHPFQIKSIVVLPSVVHTIWKLPENDDNFSIRWSLIKTQFSKQMHLPEHRSPVQIDRGKKGIWQRRFWEQLIRNEDDMQRHIEMIHTAPVHAGLTPYPRAWPWSSIHKDSSLEKVRPRSLSTVGFGKQSASDAGKLHLTRRKVQISAPPPEASRHLK